jgi:threonyl-tRNA synthetase
MRRRLDAAGYREVKTPQLMDARQWEQSGHWGKYRENMFVVPDEVPNTEDEGPVVSGDADLMALKPMNCPAHVLIFRQGIKLPRPAAALAEFGCCHRNEPHGALHGMMRVRQFTQDDAHIFCTRGPARRERCGLLRPARHASTATSASTYAIKLALRPEKRFGSDEMWDKAEQSSCATRSPRRARHAGIRLGGAAGRRRLLRAQARIPPDRRDRPHLAGRHHPDRPVLPERLDATYVGEDGERHRRSCSTARSSARSSASSAS